MEKPLGQKAYGHIPHLPGSRMGPADHHCHEGQARICTERTRDRHDLVIVEEKLDGSCTSVARIGDEIVALGRAGYRAASSPHEQHHLFAAWAEARADLFRAILNDGERIVGEWLAQAHGTRYVLAHEPWVAFDIMRGIKRVSVAERRERIAGRLPEPRQLHSGGPLAVGEAMTLLGPFGHHGATDFVEGAVWRIERKGAVDFLAKWVRPDKVDGAYLPEVSKQPAIWNWRP